VVIDELADLLAHVLPDRAEARVAVEPAGAVGDVAETSRIADEGQRLGPREHRVERVEEQA
jgi:hypothetical protein